MPGAFFYDPRFLLHGSPTHRERPERLQALEKALLSSQLAGRLEHRPVREATRTELERVHQPGYIDRLVSFCAHGGGWLDEDTYASSASEEVARLAAGAALAAVEAVLQEGAPWAFVASRPPGHHATTDQAMGFCLYNHVALAARHAQAVLGVRRVAILDWDVHHGNGTQDIFYEDPSVLFVSLHQSPLYPGTGQADERGRGPGLGTTLNLPLPARQGDEVYLGLMEEVVRPAVLAFEPELILVSAGYDAHERDFLAEMHLSTQGFGKLARAVHRLAHDSSAQGRLVGVLEGGYDLEALAGSVLATLGAWEEPAAGD